MDTGGSLFLLKGLVQISALSDVFVFYVCENVLLRTLLYVFIHV